MMRPQKTIPIIQNVEWIENKILIIFDTGELTSFLPVFEKEKIVLKREEIEIKEVFVINNEIHFNETNFNIFESEAANVSNLKTAPKTLKKSQTRPSIIKQPACKMDRQIIIGPNEFKAQITFKEDLKQIKKNNRIEMKKIREVNASTPTLFSRPANNLNSNKIINLFKKKCYSYSTDVDPEFIFDDIQLTPVEDKINCGQQRNSEKYCPRLFVNKPAFTYVKHSECYLLIFIISQRNSLLYFQLKRQIQFILKALPYRS